MTAALYARVSSQGQKEDKTIESQIDEVIQYAHKNGFTIPQEWIFKDEGISGSILERPGLEQLRDLAAQGRFEVVLCYSPDRLSRKFAYQALLIEEFKNNGVETRFLNTPQGSSPENNLLLQFQGMIAEYERALITERCRRGKKHSARQGNVSALANAPYGYRYVKINDKTAKYEIDAYEANIVKTIFHKYTEDGLSLRKIGKWLTENKIITRKGNSHWDTTVIRDMLRNPAYMGTACYGKTKSTPKKNSPLNRRKKSSARLSRINQDKNVWIEIAVPAIISKEIYFIAGEALERNKQLSARNTVEHTLLQGLIVCAECGRSYCKKKTSLKQGNRTYYRCLGADKCKINSSNTCKNKSKEQEYLDNVVWKHIISLLQNPELIKEELEKRIVEAKKEESSVLKYESIKSEIIRAENAINNFLDGLKNGLLTLEELQEHMPGLREKKLNLEKQLRKLEAEKMQNDEALMIANSLETFVGQLNRSLTNLDILEKKRIVQTFVKEIVVGRNTITINHSVPIRNMQNCEGKLLLCDHRYKTPPEFPK
jgi:site-specific DNA recombinase